MALLAPVITPPLTSFTCSSVIQFNTLMPVALFLIEAVTPQIVAVGGIEKLKPVAVKKCVLALPKIDNVAQEMARIPSSSLALIAFKKLELPISVLFVKEDAGWYPVVLHNCP